MTASTGQRLGQRYLLRERIAVGGMGEVWLGTDEVLRREVAIKVLRGDLGAGEAFKQRFRSEARIAAMLAHEGIAATYDYGEADESAYLVMELVDGEPLSTLIRRHGTLQSDRALELLSQAAHALHAAHERGVVHRDVKPANIMITPDGRVKITDFGIARPTDYEPLTATGQVMGTAHYLAPEVARGGTATAVSDVYALGVVMYEALAGWRPFDGPNQVAVATAHLHQAPPPLPQTIPSGVTRLVMQALSKDPADRPQTAEAFAQAMEALRRGGRGRLGGRRASFGPLGASAALPPPRDDAPDSAPVGAVASAGGPGPADTTDNAPEPIGAVGAAAGGLVAGAAAVAGAAGIAAAVSPTISPGSAPDDHAGADAPEDPVTEDPVTEAAPAASDESPETPAGEGPAAAPEPEGAPPATDPALLTAGSALVDDGDETGGIAAPPPGSLEAGDGGNASPGGAGNGTGDGSGVEHDEEAAAADAPVDPSEAPTPLFGIPAVAAGAADGVPAGFEPLPRRDAGRTAVPPAGMLAAAGIAAHGVAEDAPPAAAAAGPAGASAQRPSEPPVFAPVAPEPDVFGSGGGFGGDHDGPDGLPPVPPPRDRASLSRRNLSGPLAALIGMVLLVVLGSCMFQIAQDRTDTAADPTLRPTATGVTSPAGTGAPTRATSTPTRTGPTSTSPSTAATTGGTARTTAPGATTAGGQPAPGGTTRRPATTAGGGDGPDENPPATRPATTRRQPTTRRPRTTWPTGQVEMIDIRAQDYVGQRSEDVVRILGDRGFPTRTVSVRSSQPRGTVVGVTPSGTVPKGITVTVMVSRGSQ